MPLNEKVTFLPTHPLIIILFNVLLIQSYKFKRKYIFWLLYIPCQCEYQEGAPPPITHFYIIDSNDSTLFVKYIYIYRPTMFIKKIRMCSFIDSEKERSRVFILGKPFFFLLSPTNVFRTWSFFVIYENTTLLASFISPPPKTQVYLVLTRKRCHGIKHSVQSGE